MNDRERAIVNHAIQQALEKQASTSYVRSTLKAISGKGGQRMANLLRHTDPRFGLVSAHEVGREAAQGIAGGKPIEFIWRDIGKGALLKTTPMSEIQKMSDHDLITKMIELGKARYSPRMAPTPRATPKPPKPAAVTVKLSGLPSHLSHIALKGGDDLVRAGEIALRTERGVAERMLAEAARSAQRSPGHAMLTHPQQLKNLMAKNPEVTHEILREIRLRMMAKKNPALLRWFRARRSRPPFPAK